MMQLFIEGQEVDINESFSTMLTSAIDDIKNFGSKESTFSKTIILPGTKRNNKLFGNIFNTTTRSDYDPAKPNSGYNFNPAVSAKCIVLNGNIQQVKGIIRLLQINIDNAFIDYEVAIVGELGGLIMKLGANKLTDLDFSSYDHTYSVANIVASWANENAGAGYVYPLIDFGTYSALKHDWEVETFRPALFAKEYIEKIFAAAGYTFDCPLFSTDRFKRIGVPHNQKRLSKIGAGLASCTIIDIPYVLTGSVGMQFTSFSGTDWILVAGNQIQYVGTPSITSAFKVIMNLKCDTTEPGGNNGIFIDILKNGIVIPAAHKLVPGWTGTEYISYEYDGPDEVINNLDYYQLRIESVDDGFGWDTVYDISGTASVTSTNPTIVNINLGDDLPLSAVIPQNILQKDFISSILKLFNLYVTENIFDEKHLIITPFVDFHDGTVEDWSMKVDRSKPIVIKPMSELNARYYEFKWKEDSDYWNDLYKKRYNEGYGSRIFDSEFQFTNEKSTIELIFAPTVLVGYAGEDKVYSTIFKQSNATEETIDSIIRLVQFKKVTGVTSWDIKDSGGVTALHTGTEYLYAGHFDDPDAPANDLNFGVPKELFFVLAGGALNVNQFNVYYSSYMAEITDKDSKLLSCTLKLSRRDWYNLSFSKYKWIDGDLWRLNKIIDYNATNEDTCKGEFIKLIYKSY